jgi:uncharacterized protein (DUF924 family)
MLSFWFGEPAASAAELQQKFQRWYVTNPDLDREIIERFAGDVERALAGELEAWRADPRAGLALLLLLDQFARTIFRGQRRAFEGDAVALELAIDMFARGLHREVSLEERLFLIMPLLHAEDPRTQQRAAQLCKELVAEAPPELRPVYAMAQEQSDKYMDIIARFGRFPHRNAALGRASTAAELEFLHDWAMRQHPVGMRDKK